MENSNTSKKIIDALLAGFVVGGVLGIVFAPSKGAVIRKKLRSEANDLIEALRKKLNKLKEKAESEFAKVKENNKRLKR